jgi:N-methylhydantoinase A/oxoprolinase/acetone carboxylase beta subunit
VKQERSGNSVVVVDVGGTTTDVGVSYYQVASLGKQQRLSKVL